MSEKPLRCALIAAAVFAVAAGCSNNSLMAPGSDPVASFAGRTGPGTRMLPGPTVAGPIIVPLFPRRNNLPHVLPAKRLGRPILFVADVMNDDVLFYDPTKVNPSPEGSITEGISSPVGVATDQSGTLYVANLGNSTITEYPAGQSRPSLTISTGLSYPFGIAVDSKSDVFVTNLGVNNNTTVVGYAAGATAPFETIDFSSLGQPIGIGIDGRNNVWVACDNTNAVFKIPAGSSTPQDANLSDLSGPMGVSFGKRDVMYVSNFAAPNVEIYAYGSTTPSETITKGIEKGGGPTLNGFAREGRFFQSNVGASSGYVVGYKKGQTAPFSTITGLKEPEGIAFWPVIKK